MEYEDFGGMRIPAPTLNKIREAIRAEARAETLQGERARNLKRRKEVGGVRGQGLGASAPTVFKAADVLLNNYNVDKKEDALLAEQQAASEKSNELKALQMMYKMAGDKENAVQKINPDSFTVESLRKFNASGDYGDLVRIEEPEGSRGKISPVSLKDYTLESLEKYQNSGSIGDLVRRENPEKDDRTAGEKKVEGYLMRMQDSEGMLSGIGETYPDFDPASRWEAIRGVTNTSTSKEMQQYKQAANEWIRAKLRKESGAVIGPEEMEKEYQTYFPVPGDSQEVVLQKQMARANAMRSLANEAGIEAPSANVAPQGETPRQRLERLRQKHKR